MTTEGLYRVIYTWPDGSRGWYSVAAISEDDAREYGERQLAREGWDELPTITFIRYMRPIVGANNAA